MRGLWKIPLFALLATLAGLPLRALQDVSPTHYYWKASAAGDSAQLLTLFCRACEDASGAGRDIPLVALLRDTLGDVNAANDRVTYLWLLTYSRPSWEKHVLSAVPFFYWKVGNGSANVAVGEQKPLMNLNLPQHSAVSSAARRVLQWSVLDPVSMSVRSTTRAYQNNSADHERLHLEEAEGYLQSAPAGDNENGLNERELNTVIARLELRKRLLGGFVGDRHAAELGGEANFENERVRARNWELLRQCADKTGLVFEPINLAGTRNQYAVLWFPLASTAPPEGVSLGPIWKLLNLKDPYTQRASEFASTAYQRSFDGGPTKEYVPLGVYSLTYPKMPLLLIDFHDTSHLRRHEMTQRAVNEITSGVIGLSRITNWYYFAGADLYNFYSARRGTAMNRTERLDCYSKFRVALELDNKLDRDLRDRMQRRVNSLAVNPLETSPRSEMLAALKRYDLLQESASSENGQIVRRLERDRRAELARFDASKGTQVRDGFFHYATLGFYTRRAKGDETFLSRLEQCRTVDYYLNFLDGISAAGTQPEVAYDVTRIKTAVAQLNALLPEVKARATRDHAQRTIEKLRSLSHDLDVKTECLAALDSLRQPGPVAAGGAAVETLELSGDVEPLP